MINWLRARRTARRLRIMIRFGWCPLCNSSPPNVDCYVCEGSNSYGPGLSAGGKRDWAGRYVFLREINKE